MIYLKVEDVKGKSYYHPYLDSLTYSKREDIKEGFCLLSSSYPIIFSYKEKGLVFLLDASTSVDSYKPDLLPLLIILSSSILFSNILLYFFLSSRDSFERDLSRYTQILEKKSYGILLADKDKKVISSNKTFDKLLGFSPFGKSLDELFTEESFRKVMQMIHGEVTTFEELDLLNPREVTTVTGFIYSTEDSKGMTLEITGFIRSISLIRAIEDRKLHERRIEDIRVVASSIAHIFNNTFSSIESTHSFLKNHLEPSICALVEETGEKLLSSKKYINLLLEFSGEKKQDLVKIDLIPLILNFYEELKKAYLSVDILEVVLPKDNEVFIKGNIDHLHSILFNLFLNSLEALEEKYDIEEMSKEGLILISLDHLFLKDSIYTYHDIIPRGSYARLVVKDNGVGMGKDEFGNIFFPFYSKNSIGTSEGLGLTSVWGSVKNHGGYFDVSSLKDEGAIFVIYFPLLEAI